MPSKNQLKQLGYHDTEDFRKNFLQPRAQNSDEWDVSVKIGMKFNRLVLFRAGELFHAAENYFGSAETACRLTQLFFFQTQETT